MPFLPTMHLDAHDDGYNYLNGFTLYTSFSFILWIDACKHVAVAVFQLID